jgi:hypothetical protein
MYFFYNIIDCVYILVIIFIFYIDNWGNKKDFTLTGMLFFYNMKFIYFFHVLDIDYKDIYRVPYFIKQCKNVII